jgi:diguanylate cyclase (GGDEF)-like protein/PAS domain S-box-containing protein
MSNTRVRKIWQRARLGAKLTIAYSVAFSILLGIIVGGYATLVRSSVTRFGNQTAQSVAQTVTRTVENAILIENEATLRARAESSRLLLEQLVASAREQPERLAALQDQAGRALESQQVGPAGYFFVVNSEGRIILHPEPELVGEDLSGADVVQRVLRQGGGFVRYEWRNPTDPASRAKTGYTFMLADWDWYVTASDYTEGFIERLSPVRLREMIAGIDLPSVEAISLSNGSGEMLAESGDWRDAIVHHGFDADRHRGRPTSTTASGATRVQVPLQSFDANVGVIYFSAELYEVLDRHLLLVLLAVGPAIFLIYLLSRTAAGLISAPLSQFTTRLNRRFSSVEGSDTKRFGRSELASMVLTQMRTLVRLDYEEKRRREAERSLVISRQVFLNTAEGICVTEPDGRITEVNPAFTRMTGYSQDELIGQKVSIFQSGMHDKVFYTEMWDSLSGNGSWSGELWNRTKDGTAVPQLCSIEAVRGAATGAVESYVAVYHDISEIKSTQQRLHHLANHDPLTGLPNRSFLSDMLGYSIAQAKRESRRLAVLFVDLDDFKDVNDSYGHDTGDRLLIWIAEKLRHELREKDIIARFGGDEFVIIIPDLDHGESVALVARRLLAAVREPYILGTQSIRPSLSIGIAVYPDGSAEQAELLRDADAAMYAAKQAGRNDYRFHDPAMNDLAHRRLAMQGAVARGLDEGEFSILYQPIVRLSDDRAVGAEALIRWDGGSPPLMPDGFMPFLESSSMITRLDLWVLEEGCGVLAEHASELPPDFYLSVNTGAGNLMVDDYVERVVEIVRRSGIDPGRICVEVTESAAIKNFERAQAALKELRRNGLSVYLDDFGAGHSSIRYLREFGVDAVKLDRQFMEGVDSSESAQSLVSGFVSLARGMNLATIIEGIETQEQLDYVRSSRADAVQGYFLCEPVPFNELLRFMRPDE